MRCVMYLLISWPTNERSSTRLGLDVLRKNGAVFKVLNLFELLYPHLVKKSSQTQRYDNEIMVHSWKELESFLKEEKKILNFLNIKKQTLKVFWLLTQLNRVYISFSNMPLPSKKSLKLSLLAMVLKPATYGAMIKPERRFPFSRETEFIPIHSIDYDTMLRFEKGKHTRIIQEKYIVFLDQNLPFHEDFIRDNESSYVTPDAYYGTLNHYFKHVEQATGKKVIIAAHPSTKDVDRWHFQSIKDHSINLIKYADAVLMHSTTAVSFAILYEKPLAMIVTDEIVVSKMHPFNQQLSLELGLPMINVNREIQVDFTYNKSKFLAYKHNYISNSPYRDLLSMEIVLKEIL